MNIDNGGWKTCFKVVRNVSLPNNLYMGFSALTGGSSAKHDIISVDTESINNPSYAGTANSNPAGNAYGEYGRKSNKPNVDKSDLGWLFYIVVGLLLLCVCYVAWNVYQQTRQNQYKRF